MRQLKALLVLSGIFLSAFSYAADLAKAKEFYSEGITLEKSKLYSAAAWRFQKSLENYPDYAPSIKELGNSFYYLGRLSDSAKCYERYLILAPTDSAARRFLTSLQSRISPSISPVPVEQAPKPEIAAHASDQKLLPGWYLQGGFGGIPENNSDIKTFFGGGSSSGISGSDSENSLLFDLQGDLLFSSGWEGLAGISFGPFRSNSIDYPSGTSLLNLSEWFLYVGGGYHWQLQKHGIGVHLLFGPSFLSGNYSFAATLNPNSDINYSLNAFTVGLNLGAWYEFLATERIGIGAEIGYHLSNFGAVNASSSTGYAATGTIDNPLKYPDGSSVNFNNSGVYFLLSFRWHLSELIGGSNEKP